MLDTLTKRRIDTARDILVGKLPDPKSQVEQITIALIYKFMDDMDKQSEELGGKATFFTGEYEKYSWSKIFDPRVSGYERINLYGEAIQKMNHNPHIPPLFRNIFKNAYLPYRDPETLKMFLKVIGEFEYDHSEKLGDAFEYLLSIMGSQGDAGQFRTPRHIIDFIVKVVDPSKNETILDPACGTAGFLISSFNHIQNKNKKDNRLNLTADERTRLINNFSGYDISPDMVRLSLVNMYLHKFPAPKIYEYDTLTSEEKWNEFYDVILANPPFMSPKGGIKPHKRFSIQAKRSEVLFVDYIAEHLNPNGRGGVIVPEGIIFKSETAYKKLRKMLIEISLYAVVSLPAGVFNPYAGVKTSILFLNKNLAKKTGKILFVKINNDGFGLGAQRREIKENDLPMALEIINKYKQSVIENKEIEFNLAEAKLAHLVKKEKIAESGNYSLSGDRYKEAVAYNGKWDFVEVENAIEKVKYTTKIKKDKFLNKGKYPIIDQSEKFIAGYWNRKEDVFRVSKPIVIFGDHTKCFKYIDFGFVLGADGVKILKPTDEYDPKFFYFILSNLKIKNLGYSRHYKELKRMKIPLPPLEIQNQIVTELDSYQKIIDGAKQVVENYKPHINIDPSWPEKELNEFVIETKLGVVKSKAEQGDNKSTPYIKMNNITLNGYLDLSDLVYVDASEKEKQTFTLNEGDFLYNTRNSPELVGKSCVYHGKNGEYLYNNNILRIKFNTSLNPDYANWLLNTSYGKNKIRKLVDGTTSVAALYQKNYLAIILHIPSRNIQDEIIAQIEKEQKVINANKELITIFENKIKEKIADVWGE
jgi:type I restriction enzyme M protein